MISKVFLLIDVPNNRIMDQRVAVVQDVDLASDFIRELWKERVKPAIGVHVFTMMEDEDYEPSERSF